jgi:3-hydroxybutyryl-CoA dehydrogenase
VCIFPFVPLPGPITFASSGSGIAFVSALRAKVPVLLHDRSPTQLTSGLALMDKILKKDVAKGKISSDDAKDAIDRVTVVSPEVGLKGLRDVDMVIEVRLSAHSCIMELCSMFEQAVSESLTLKQAIFKALASELQPNAILATNTSSISITKIASSTVPDGEGATSVGGRKNAGRVVGEFA